MAGCESQGEWECQRLRRADNRGLKAQRDAAAQRGIECIGRLTPGCFAVIQTQEEDESSGHMRGCRWFLVQAHAWQRSVMSKKAQRRGSCNPACVKNTQVYNKNDLLIRVTYFLEDEDDEEGAFSSTGCVVDAISGGALRHVLLDGDVDLREGGLAVLTEGAAEAIERAIISC